MNQLDLLVVCPVRSNGDEVLKSVLFSHRLILLHFVVLSRYEMKPVVMR